MGNFLNRLKKNTNRIVHTQIMNAPDFKASAAKFTGGEKDPRRLARMLNSHREVKNGRRFKSRLCEFD